MRISFAFFLKVFSKPALTIYKGSKKWSGSWDAARLAKVLRSLGFSKRIPFIRRSPFSSIYGQNLGQSIGRILIITEVDAGFSQIMVICENNAFIMP